MAKGLNGHIEYTEELLERKLNNHERYLFEWAYTQGYEDSSEGTPMEKMSTQGIEDNG
ncbi:hypothetical protein [Mesobacillus zeae]|uniref:hypothetical protein n=1 Tax=Mesobacillus zeae TaxID=1917180 RepID=UPI0015E6509B|nr:hypothetical protein [Mesobacillus zeae]